MEVVLKSAASAVIAYTAHYASAKFYTYACVPDGWMGYLSGMIRAGSPVCQVGVQIISSTQMSYSSMLLMGISRVLVDLVAPGASLSK
jgi:hypothetical protein